jgi:hypothetical protein
MSIATTIVKNTPIFGKMFAVDKSTGLEEINAWPALMIMSSFVWLVVAGLLGLVMPATQIFDLGSDHFYTTLTLHGAALTFPFSFQLMMGVGLHRSGGCVGKAITGWLPALAWLSMNVGAAILTVAVLMGLKVSVVVMFPLPLVGAQMGVWSMESVIVGFTGIYLVLACMILCYPLLVLKMMFFGKKRQELVLSERSLNEPGMLGMLLAAATLLLTGLPLVVVGTTLLLALYKILPMSLAAWAADPVVFQYTFYLFAHNLMEAMALMVASAMYATLPLYLADGSRKLYSEKLANLALVGPAGDLGHFRPAPFHHLLPEPAGGPVLLGQHHELGHRHGCGDQHLHRPRHHLAARAEAGARHHRRARRLGALHPRRRQRHRHLQHRLDLPVARHHVAERPLHDGHPGHVHDVDGRAVSPLSGADGPQARPGAGQSVCQDDDRRQLRRGDRHAGGRRGRHAAALRRLAPGRLDALRQPDPGSSASSSAPRLPYISTT